MGMGFQGMVLKAMGARELHLRATKVATQTDGLFTRVTFTADEHFPDELFAPTTWLRLWFVDADGKSVQRGYSVAGYGPTHESIDVLFYLHDDAGPASTWARDAAEGMTLTAHVAGSRQLFIDPNDGGLVAVADESAYPALLTMLRVLPRTMQARVLLTGEHDLTDTIDRTNSHLWVQHTPSESAVVTARDMIERLHRTGDDRGSWLFWAAGEHALIQGLRDVIGHEALFDKPHRHLQAYWVAR